VTNRPQINERENWNRALHDSVSVSDKKWFIAVLLSAALGIFGADRFYLGRPFLGLLKMFTGGFVGIWWAADFILLLRGKMRDGEGKLVKK
jgi:hypothetical protein